MLRFVGNSPSAALIRNTTGNSSPFAWWTVMSLTLSEESAGCELSASEISSVTFARKSSMPAKRDAYSKSESKSWHLSSQSS